MLLLFLILFITFEAVLIKSETPSRGGTSSASSTTGLVMRTATPTTPGKSDRSSFPRCATNGLNREEFQAMKANELVSMINDPVLAKFAVESSNKYSEQTVALVKRIKAWGRQWGEDVDT